MAQLKILNQHGDQVITWDKELENQVNGVVSPAEAEKAFNQMRDDNKYLAYRTDADGQNPEVIRPSDGFDPDAEAIVMAPQMVGG